MEELLRGQSRQQPVDAAVWSHLEVVVPRVDPQLEIARAPFRCDVRRPCHGERMHPVFGFEDVGRVEAVLTAGAGNDAVVGAVGLAMPVAKIAQLLLALRPDDAVALPLGEPTRVTDALRVEANRLLPRRLRVL